MKSREERREEVYAPSLLWLACGVLFPPLGVYQMCRLIGQTRRATKETNELARQIREDTARRHQEQAAQQPE